MKKGNGECLGYRQNGQGPYKWIKYSEVIDQTKFVGSGLVNKGIEPGNSTNIGIYSRNCPEVCYLRLGREFHVIKYFNHFLVGYY